MNNNKKTIRYSWYEMPDGNSIVNFKYSSGSTGENPEIIILLDRSGSMGSFYETVHTKILPGFIRKLNYSNTEKIRVLNFEKEVISEYVTAEELSRSKLECDCDNRLDPAVKELFTLLKNTNQKVFRVLLLTDGNLEYDGDDGASIDTWQTVSEYVKNQGLKINARAVRMHTGRKFTSLDLKEITSFLKLNSLEEGVKYTDIERSLSNDQMINELVKLFENDGLTKVAEIESNIPLKKGLAEPGLKHLILIQGQNSFFAMGNNLKFTGDNCYFIENKSVKVNADNFKRIAREIIKYEISKCINNVLSGGENTENLKSIEEYSKLEKILQKDYSKEMKYEKLISSQIKKINDNETLKHFTIEQKFELLNSVGNFVPTVSNSSIN